MLVRHGTDRLVPVSHAAVSKDAYLVQLRDGRRTDEVERALSLLETEALPVLRDLRGRWPLDHRDRALVAEYVAAQMARTPDALRRHARLVDDALRDHGYPDARGDGWRHGRDGLRMRAMIFIAGRVMTLVSAMQWSLVSFGRPVLSTSDHPVAVGSIDLAATRADLGIEVDNIGELWLPIDPQLLLVCCWRDLPDVARPLGGRRRIAESVNAAMRDQAEAGWYSRPGQAVPMPVDGRIGMCGERLFAGYGPAAIRRSAFRPRALREVASAAGDLPNVATMFDGRKRIARRGDVDAPARP